MSPLARRLLAVVLPAFLLAAAPAAAGERRGLEARCRAEVVELHEFLEAWSNAELPPTDEAFARFADVLAPSFELVGPDGERAGRAAIVDAIRAAHGRWREAPGAIRIENYRLLQAGGDLALASYEEWHDLGEARGRLSTVLFGRDDDAPNGVAWLHLHEVWIEPEAADDDLAARLDRRLAEIYPAGEPGAAVLLTKDGETVLRAAYGMADLELGVPLEPGMIFRLGSITKQFTAAAILLLEEQGLLSVDDPITRFLPDYPVGDAVVTIEHLLTHTSGIFSYTSIPGYMNNRVRLDLSTDELIAEFSDRPLEFTPGERWSYSNSGYVLLGAILERAAGRSYADVVRERLFEPLGMERSHYGGHQILPGRVSGYDRGPEGWANAAYLSMTQPHAAGALLSTVDDLERWDRALHGGELLSPASYRKMTTRYRLADGDEADYGYGLSLSTLRGRPVIQHGGGIFGFSTFALRMPEEDLFVAILSNGAGREPSPGPVALEIAALVIGDPFPEFEPAEVDPETLERLAGVYEIESGGTRTVTVDGGRLYTQRDGGTRLEAVPAGDDTFFYEGSHTYFRIIGEEGRWVMQMHHDGADEPERAVWSGPPPAPRQKIELTPEQLADAVGRYELAPGFVLEITLVDGQLMSQATGQPRVPIYAEAPDRFFLEVVDAQVELVRDEAGRVTGLTLFQGDLEIPGKRL